MLNHEKLTAVQTIIVHDNCADGLMSALFLKDAYTQAGLHPDIRFLQYGTEPYKALEPAPHLLFCDFSPFVPEVEVGGRKVPHPERLAAWVESGALILDHHKGARAVVEAFGDNGIFGDEGTQPGVSGAWLAFQNVWLPLYAERGGWGPEKLSDALYFKATTLDDLTKQLENDLSGNKDFHDEVVDAQDSSVLWASNLAVLAGIRDTWLNKHPRWREACVLGEVLRFYPNDDWLEKVLPFHPGNRGFWNERLKLGNILWTKHEKSVAKSIEKSWRFTSGRGTRVLVFEGVRLSSDVAEAVDADFDLVMGFDYEVEAPENATRIRKIIYSTRSHTDFNCMSFCKSFGGGGHTKAAGFSVVIDPKSPQLSRFAHSQDPYSLAETLVWLYEENQKGA